MEVKFKMMTFVNENCNLCRVCLSSDENNQCIFQTNQNEPKTKNTLDFSKKLQLCGGVEVLENDGLPERICTKCVSKVNAAHELREQCQKVDAKLRELYGKVIQKGDSYKHIELKDQYCQTDQLFVDLIKKEYNASSYFGNTLCIKDDSFKNIRNVNENNTNVINIGNNQGVRLQNTNDTKNKLTEQNGSSIKKEAYRTRRVTMFKRVTSMENLKNHKERQRQYIKKTLNVKVDSNERDSHTNVNVTCNKVNRVSSCNSESTFLCPKCNQCYSNKKSLDRHTITHDDKKFKCEKSDKQFFHPDKLFQHGKLHRTNEKSKTVSCKICNKNFRKTDTMVRHLNAHKRDNPKEVFSILKEIRDKRKLENNIDILKADMQNLINDDQKTMSEKEIVKNGNNAVKNDLRNPVQSVRHKIHNLYISESEQLNKSSNTAGTCDNNISFYHCKHCNKCYSTERSLQRHLLMHNEKKFICKVCNMKFFRQDRLKSHRDRYGHDEDKECSVPQKPPDDKLAIKIINSWIREELDSDNEGKGFPCKICGKSYDTKKSLLKHQSNMHVIQKECTNCIKDCTCAEKCKESQKDNEKLKIYTCDECNKSFGKEIKLQRHVRIHERTKEQQDSNFKRFLCHICSKTFRQNTGLMFHMRTHTGYKPHVCKYCGRGFTSNSNCINHERTHTGDRPFVCHFCSAAFAKSCTLKAHITTHTGEANYHCKTCGKSFRRLKYLKEHKFTHTGEKPYACKICGTAYSHSGSLFVHEKKCKAQYNNYQSPPIQNTQNYCQSQTNVTTSVPVIAPIFTTLPQSHLNNINNTLNSQTNKIYMNSLQRMNVHTASSVSIGTSGLDTHSNQEVSDMTSAVRNFTIIGQVFNS